ncbi:oxidoreductase [Sphingomonas crusticola]|uniref:oxidoreductase n=1 Tax=Sphingomonas crusticola TaxID=1697973 RepID=UPI000E24E358|nr:oxidoreductase [Sphingomonas crusticola]
MTINVALIGYGLAGASFHAPLIACEPRFSLTRVVTRQADAVAQAFPAALVSPDTAAVFADESIDLVVVATPNQTHVPLTREALAAGKHVVVDKPFALDVADSEALIALAKAQDRMLTVFHNRRWDSDFLTVAALVASGRLGEIALAELRWDRFRPEIKPGWKEEPGAGSGVLVDLGPHLIDQALRLFGDPDRIVGDIACQRPASRVDDYFELTLHYGARRVILSAATLLAAPRPRFALHGMRGSFVKYGIDPQEAALRAGTAPDDPGFGVEPPEDHGILTDAAGSQPLPSARGDWRLFYRAVADAILDQAPPPVDPADAIAGLRIIECARRSAHEGRVLDFTRS